MKIYKGFLAVLFFAMTFVGCVSVVDIEDQLHEKERLVLYCRLCPQSDTTWVHLTRTHLLYGSGSEEDIQPVTTAVVELSADNEHWTRATYDAVRRQYALLASDFPVVEGATYYIRAYAEGYDEVSASCTVPFSYDIHLRITNESAQYDNHYGTFYPNPHWDTYVSWDDPAGVTNYYAFGSVWEEEYTDWDEKITKSFPASIFEFVDLSVNDTWYSIFSDEGRDGQTFRYLYDYDIDPEDDEPADIRWIFFLDRHSYLYETTLHDYDGLSTFLLEPTQTYSNIHGGFGLFAAFSIVPVPNNL